MPATKKRSKGAPNRSSQTPRRPSARRTGDDTQMFRVAAAGVAALVLLAGVMGVLPFTSAVFLVAFLAGAAFVVWRSRALLRSASSGTVASVTLLVAVFVVPVAFDPLTLDVFNVTKALVIVAAGLVVAVSWIHDVAAERPPAWRNGLHWPVLALLAWVALTTATSVHPRVSVIGEYGSYLGLYVFAASILCFAVAASDLRGGRHALAVLTVASGGVVLVLALFQLHDRVASWLGTWDWVEWGSSAPFVTTSIWSTLGNPNHLGSFLAMLVPPAAAITLLERRRWLQIAAVGIGAASVVVTTYTASRGAWLGLVAGAVVTGLLLVPEARRQPKLAGVGLAAFAVTAVAAVLLAAPNIDLGERVSGIFQTEAANTGGQRLQLWESALDMAADRPVIGMGTDSYLMEFSRYQTEEFVRTYGPLQGANGPHNVFFKYLSEHGVPGLLLFLSVLAVAGLRTAGAWRRIRRAERDGDDEAREGRLVLTGLVGALVCYLVQASFNVEQVALLWLFWVLLGYLVAETLRAGVPVSLSPAVLVWPSSGVAADEGAVPTTRGRRPRRPAKRSSAPTVAAAIAGVVAIVLLWSYSGSWRADRSLDAALRLDAELGEQEPGTVQAESIARVQEKLEAAASASPWEATYQRSLARFYEGMAANASATDPGRARAALEDALDLRRRAADLRPHDSIVLSELADTIGSMRALGDDSDLAAEQREVLESAVNANPWHTRPMLALLELLVPGSEEEALQILGPIATNYFAEIEIVRHAARLEQSVGDASRARQHWERVLEIAPDDVEAARALDELSS